MKKNKSKIDKGFFIVYREWLRDCLKKLKTLSEAKTFLTIKMNVYFAGTNKGKYFFKLEDFAKEIGIHENTLSISLHSLDRKEFIKYHPNTNNKAGINMVEIVDYKKENKSETAIVGNGGLTKETAIADSAGSNADSTDSNVDSGGLTPNSRSDKALQFSNNILDKKILENNMCGAHTSFKDLKKFLEKLHNKEINMKNLKKLCADRDFKYSGILAFAIKDYHESLPTDKQVICNANPLRFWRTEVNLEGEYLVKLASISKKEAQERGQKYYGKGQNIPI